MATLHYLLHCIGKDCGACLELCEDELSLPCSPNCELLGADRSREIKKCLEAGCDVYEPGVEMIPVVIELTQQDYIRLLEKTRLADLTAEVVLHMFASDLSGGEWSGGSDEQMYVESWFNRRCF